MWYAGTHKRCAQATTTAAHAGRQMHTTNPDPSHTSRSAHCAHYHTTWITSSRGHCRCGRATTMTSCCAATTGITCSLVTGTPPLLSSPLLPVCMNTASFTSHMHCRCRVECTQVCKPPIPQQQCMQPRHPPPPRVQTQLPCRTPHNTSSSIESFCGSCGSAAHTPSTVCKPSCHAQHNSAIATAVFIADVVEHTYLVRMTQNHNQHCKLLERFMLESPAHLHVHAVLNPVQFLPPQRSPTPPHSPTPAGSPCSSPLSCT